MDAGEGPRTVLVIDDDDELLDVVTDVLRERGYVVVNATDGASALRLLAAVEVSLVISDLSMPVMGGMEFLDATKASKAEGIPIVLMTGSGISTVPPAGCVAILPKPFTQEALLAIVAEYAGSSER